MRSQKNGLVLLVAQSSEGPSDTAFVTVEQRVTAIRFPTPADSINKLSGTAQLNARVVDRNGAIVPGVSVVWRSIDGQLATVDSTGLVIGRAVGLAPIEARVSGIADTITVFIRQIAASLSMGPLFDTLNIDQVVRFIVSATDSNGFAIPDPDIMWESSDSAVASVDSGGNLIALAPGPAVIRTNSGGDSSQTEVFVEGVAVYVNGQRWSQPGLLSPSDRVTITNGRLRLQRSDSPEQQAGMEADARIGDQWLFGTARWYGDWTYVSSSVVTAPTRIELLAVSGDEVAVRWTFGNHWFLPRSANLSPRFQDQAYPFEKTVWLRRGEQGYYTLINPLTQLDPEVTVAEHEVGFGGIYGPAQLRTAKVSLLTDTLSTTFYYNLEEDVDAVELARQGDPLHRVLVPLGPTPLATARWSMSAFGGAYIHSSLSGTYGAYLYVAPSNGSTPANAICRLAWQGAPFPLPAVSNVELDNCGPHP